MTVDDLAPRRAIPQLGNGELEPLRTTLAHVLLDLAAKADTPDAAAALRRLARQQMRHDGAPAEHSERRAA